MIREKNLHVMQGSEQNVLGWLKHTAYTLHVRTTFDVYRKLVGMITEDFASLKNLKFRGFVFNFIAFPILEVRFIHVWQQHLVDKHFVDWG